MADEMKENTNENEVTIKQEADKTQVVENAVNNEETIEYNNCEQGIFGVESKLTHEEVQFIVDCLNSEKISPETQKKYKELMESIKKRDALLEYDYVLDYYDTCTIINVLNNWKESLNEYRKENHKTEMPIYLLQEQPEYEYEYYCYDSLLEILYLCKDKAPALLEQVKACYGQDVFGSGAVDTFLNNIDKKIEQMERYKLLNQIIIKTNNPK